MYQSDSAPTAEDQPRRIQVYLLQVLGPVCRLGHGHEAAVGQDGAHDEQTEQGEQVKEEQGLMTSSSPANQRSHTHTETWFHLDERATRQNLLFTPLVLSVWTRSDVALRRHSGLEKGR